MNFLDLLNKEWFRVLAALFIGVTVGVLFYPSKKIEEKVTQKYEQEISTLKESYSKEVQNITEKYASSLKESKEFHLEAEHKISTLTSQVSELKSKQKISTYKLVKPDGTIEERSFTENEIDQSTKTVTKIQDEFKQKVDAIETKWSQIHKERVAKIQKDFDSKEAGYQKTISEYQMSKVTSVNEKHFGLEGGMMSNKNYYGHASMDLWGPVFVGVHGELGQNNDNKLGLGLGLRF
jgi:uncharacterized membrane-anchored protein YhcB (DUF1043 family)